jgi:hypothetical protein
VALCKLKCEFVLLTKAADANLVDDKVDDDDDAVHKSNCRKGARFIAWWWWLARREERQWGLQASSCFKHEMREGDSGGLARGNYGTNSSVGNSVMCGS